MNGFIKYLICYCVVFAAVYLCGFGALTDGISDSLAVSIIARTSLFLAGICFLLWKGYDLFSRKNRELSDKIKNLEEEIARLKDNKE